MTTKQIKLIEDLILYTESDCIKIERTLDRQAVIKYIEFQLKEEIKKSLKRRKK